MEKINEEKKAAEVVRTKVEDKSGINWKVRTKNPVFWFNVLIAVCVPVLAYYGLTVEDMTSWSKVGEVIFAAFQNPFVVGTMAVGLWNAINDPTTAGVTDSYRAMNYNEPNK